MKFTAVGDILAQKRMPRDYEGFDEIKKFIAQGDVRFSSFESTINYEEEVFGSQFSGGTYVRTTPEVFHDMMGYGFNMTNFNQNHAMDFSFEGLIKTIEYAKKEGIVHSGIGLNMGQASSPNYLETENGRVALISVCSTFNPAMMAGDQSRHFRGRPGINGLRHTRTITLPKAEFEQMQDIADKLKINATNEVLRKEGYRPELPEGVGEFGDMQFVLGDEYAIHTYCNTVDLERVKKAITEATYQADYVMVSVHSHQQAGTEKETHSEFLEEFAHFCIDNGADAVVGHGPHLLRAIEVYKDRPIFYSLGDFVIQLYSVPVAPEDFYQQQSMTSDSTVTELLMKRSANFTRGLMEEDRMLETVIPFWETDGKKLKSLYLMPVKASTHEGKHVEGLPKPVKDTAFVEKLARLSAPYGVKITMTEDGIAKCDW